ncbi:MAG TPA: hypothetical protein VII96_03900 [Acidimicrobiales bacterium]
MTHRPIATISTIAMAGLALAACSSTSTGSAKPAPKHVVESHPTTTVTAATTTAPSSNVPSTTAPVVVTTTYPYAAVRAQKVATDQAQVSADQATVADDQYQLSQAQKRSLGATLACNDAQQGQATGKYPADPAAITQACSTVDMYAAPLPGLQQTLVNDQAALGAAQAQLQQDENS